MRINCEIDNIKTLKKGMKITLSIPLEETKNTMKDIHNFIDRPLIVDFLINAKEVKQRMEQITPEQRKKIYALFNDIDRFTGIGKDNIKDTMKNQFLQDSEYEEFSLSNCSKKIAEDFIEYLIQFCFENGIDLSEHPKEGFDDIERYIALCNKNKICAICGDPGELHHMTGSRIGMGNNRRKTSDEGRKLICLCRSHHSELHNMPEEEFFKKYHLVGV